jgi:hypothetical protein
MIKQLIHIALLVFFFFFLHNGFGFCEQKNRSILTTVRTGEHENFTRIVFEFQNAVRFKDPKIKDKGKFSLLFLDSATNLPPLTVYWTDSAHKVRSVEFIKNKSDLTANITLTFPYFMLKTFSISSPGRVVVDAYKLFALSKDSVQSTSLLNDGVHFKYPESREQRSNPDKTMSK